MKRIDQLEKYRDVRDKFQSNYIVICNGLTYDDALTILFKKLDTINTIKDSVKRKYLNDRVYSLIEYMKQKRPEDKDTTLYLVGKDLEVIPLKKKWIGVLNEWDVSDFIFMNGEYFDIDYLNSLFLDTDYHDIIQIMNKSLKHVHLNRTKRKVKHEEDIGSTFDLGEYISKNTKGRCMVHGVSSTIKSFKTKNENILLFTKRMTDDRIFEEFDKHLMLDVHKQVQELIGHMQNEKMMHRVKVGKDIQKAIKCALIQTLYSTPEKAKLIREKVPKDLQNFEIVEVFKLEKGDIGDVLEKDYNGVLGFTYY